MELFKEYQRGDISYMEFRVSNALKTVEVLDLYRPRATPSKPVELLKFEDDKRTKDWDELSLEKKNKVTAKYMSYNAVKDYYDKLDATETENESNAHHLEETCLILLKAGMIRCADQVWDVLDTFPNQVRSWRKPNWYETEKEKAKSLNRTAETDQNVGRAVEPSGKDQSGVQERTVRKGKPIAQPSHPVQANLPAPLGT